MVVDFVKQFCERNGPEEARHLATRYNRPEYRAQCAKQLPNDHSTKGVKK